MKRFYARDLSLLKEKGIFFALIAWSTDWKLEPFAGVINYNILSM